MWLSAGICLSVGVSSVLAVYVFSRIRGAYLRGERFPKRLLPLWYAMWAFHHVPVALASFEGVWLLPFGSGAAFVLGVLVLATGATLLVVGMIQFGSYARSAGQDSSRLITAGIYRWSRNPQVVGWFMMLLGPSIAGWSGLALLLTAVFGIVLHAYTVRLEEPYLERIYGEQYLRYKMTAHRYLGAPRLGAGPRPIGGPGGS